jgi:hypothetical protein
MHDANLTGSQSIWTHTVDATIKLIGIQTEVVVFHALSNLLKIPLDFKKIPKKCKLHYLPDTLYVLKNSSFQPSLLDETALHILLSIAGNHTDTESFY